MKVVTPMIYRCSRPLRYLPTVVKSDNVEGWWQGNEERKWEAVIADLLNYGLASIYDRFPYAGITRTGSKGHSARSRGIPTSKPGISQPMSSPSIRSIRTAN